jgi:hypothetical protein
MEFGQVQNFKPTLENLFRAGIFNLFGNFLKQIN